jgi:ketosteroid isomerase-like protein
MTRTPQEDAEPENAVGTYMTIWHRQGDGSFKIAYDIWNSDRPFQSEAE